MIARLYLRLAIKYKINQMSIHISRMIVQNPESLDKVRWRSPGPDRLNLPGWSGWRLHILVRGIPLRLPDNCLGTLLDDTNGQLHGRFTGRELSWRVFIAFLPLLLPIRPHATGGD